MSSKRALPDEILDAVAGGVMKIGGPDGETVTEFEVGSVDGVTTAFLTTDAGKKYTLQSRMFDEAHFDDFLTKMDKDDSMHGLDSWGKLTPVE